MVQFTTKINRIRRDIAHIELTQKCKQTNSYTANQKRIRNRLIRKYRNIEEHTLTYHIKCLKQELKATSSRLNHQKKVSERKRINKLFSTNPRSVYRSFKAGNTEIKVAPTPEEIEDYWNDIWGTTGHFNNSPEWLNVLEKEYRDKIQPEDYNINVDTLQTAIKKLQDNKSPGKDLIVGYWYKSLTFYRNDLVELHNNTFTGLIEIPTWMAKAKTILLPKNDQTNWAKNYRPIALQNIMLKLYTGCINQFLQDHYKSSNIITAERAGRKKEVWRCLEQLMINKTILEEVTENRRSLITMWLDYQKVFDSVPHKWLIKALELEKVPERIITAIKTLMKKWSTNVNIQYGATSIESQPIQYLRGIFQGDSGSVLLFFLSVNPLSYLLNKLQGYGIGKTGNRNQNISHLFFIDDLKLFATNINQMKLLLDQVPQFSNDIGMKFGQSKCSYMVVEKGKTTAATVPITINSITINPVKEGDSYKYLGQDENLGYVGPVNKKRVTSEYYKRVKKIWKSELSAYNKHVAHNAFAVPVLIPTFGLLNWTINEIEQIDIKTRNILCMTGNFHRNSDIDRLYLKRKNGGRGFKCIKTTYEARIVAARRHLLSQKNTNRYLAFVINHEESRLLRVGRELLANKNIEDNENWKPSFLSRIYVREMLKIKAESFTNKHLHGYIRKKIIENEDVDQKLTDQWSNNKYIPSHFGAYTCAIQEQEIGTKDLKRIEK